MGIGSQTFLLIEINIGSYFKPQNIFKIRTIKMEQTSEIKKKQIKPYGKKNSLLFLEIMKNSIKI